MTTPAELLSIYTAQSQISNFFINEIGQIWVSAYGAVGDGVTDDTLAVQAAVDAAIAAGVSEVNFTGGKTYKITSLSNTTGIVFLGNNVTITGGASIEINNLAGHMEDFVSAKRFSSLQACIDAAHVLGGGNIEVPAGTYAETLTLYSNIHLRLAPNAIIDISGASANAIAFDASGSEGTHVALSGDTLVNATSVSADETSFAAGDYVKIGSTAVFDTGRTNTPLGEINIIESVASGVINLKLPLQSAYATADSAFIAKLTMLENITIEGGQILGNSATNLYGVKFDYCVNSKIIGTKIKDVKVQGVRIKDCVNVNARGLSVSGCNHATNGYGVIFQFAAQDCSVSDSYFLNCRHGVTLGGGTDLNGIVRRISHENIHVNSSVNSGDAIDAHACCEDISYNGIWVDGSSQFGLNFEGASGNFSNINIKHTLSNGMTITNYTDKVGKYVVNGVQLSDIAYTGLANKYAFRMHGSKTAISGCTVSGVRAEFTAKVVGNHGFFLLNVSDSTFCNNIVPNGDRGVTQDNNCTYNMFIGNNLRGCTTPLNLGTGTGHIYKTAANDNYNMV